MDDCFAPGRSPALNGLLKAARTCYDDLEQVASSFLQENLQHVAEVRRTLEAQYLENMQLRPHTRLYRELDPGIRAGFAQFHEGLKAVERFLATRDPEILAEGCAIAREAVEQLMDHLGRMGEEEQGFPVYSESPYVHELSHVALGVAKGEFPPEALRGRLDAFRERYTRTRTDFAEWTKGGAENATVAALVPQVEKAMVALGRGLDEMAEFFADHNKDHLRRGGEVVLKSSEALTTLHKRLLDAVAPSVMCPRCGHQNQPGTRFCGQCNARLPESTTGPASSMSVSDGGGEQPPPRFAHIVRVEEAVEGHLAGDVPREELRRTLEWFARGVAQGRQDLANLRPPERFPSPEAEAEAKAVRSRMEQASKLFADGAAQMLHYCQTEELDSLRHGLQQVLQGEKLMGTVQQDLSAAQRT